MCVSVSMLCVVEELTLFSAAPLWVLVALLEVVWVSRRGASRGSTRPHHNVTATAILDKAWRISFSDWRWSCRWAWNQQLSDLESRPQVAVFVVGVRARVWVLSVAFHRGAQPLTPPIFAVTTSSNLHEVPSTSSLEITSKCRPPPFNFHLPLGPASQYRESTPSLCRPS